MTNTSQSVCLPARFSSLPALLAALPPLTTKADSGYAPIDEHTLLRAQTVVEELFANSVHHGYSGESTHPVWLESALVGSILRVVYADAAPAYNPLVELENAPPVINDQGEASRIGGAGQRLIHGLADSCNYRWHNDRNEVTLEFKPRP